MSTRSWLGPSGSGIWTERRVLEVVETFTIGSLQVTFRKNPRGSLRAWVTTWANRSVNKGVLRSLFGSDPSHLMRRSYDPNKTRAAFPLRH